MMSPELWRFLSTVVICGTVMYVVRSLIPVISGRNSPVVKAAPVLPDAEEDVRSTLAGAAPPRTDPIPVDLIQYAERESESWAREQVINSMIEMYEQTGDWNVVRGLLRATPSDLT